MNGHRVYKCDFRFILILSCVIAGMIGCGRKAPPLPPAREEAASIQMEERDAGALTKRVYHEGLEKGCGFAHQVSGYDKTGATTCRSAVVEFSY